MVSPQQNSYGKKIIDDNFMQMKNSSKGNFNVPLENRAKSPMPNASGYGQQSDAL